MGVFDQLHRQLGADDEDRGISPLDLAELSPPARKIMRYMLREVEMYYTDLVEWVDGWPEEERLTHEELDQILSDLASDQWLIKMGDENILYEANLRRKRPSSLAKTLWANLDSKIAAQRKLRDEQAQELDEEPPE